MDPHQLVDYIIRPAMPSGWGGQKAEVLLLATAAQESHCGHYVHQIHGPACGIFQMEPATHDLVMRWLNAHEPTAVPDYHHDAGRLVYDMQYAAVLARGLYRSIPEPLPEPTLVACWPYYKRHYNSLQGAATEEQFAQNWGVYVAPYLASLVA